ncbi:MAG: hypothetical protein LBE82_09300 [Chitinophagaceae bacterium]|jgi:iron-sulfur cluster repair protein YtfE (RIC family)|nr:hypothetical protein [Chitinophagaceae bacterium]
MFSLILDMSAYNASSSAELCTIIQQECHPEIENLFHKIHHFLTQNPDIKDFSLSDSELLQLLFFKLQDETKHLLLKERLLLLPSIQENTGNEQSRTNIDSKSMTHLIKNARGKIIDSIKKIRSLLQDYQVKENWQEDVKQCIQNFEKLETAIIKWITLEHNLLYPKTNGTDLLS